MRIQNRTVGELLGAYNSAYNWYAKYIPNIENTRLKIYKDQIGKIENNIDNDNKLSVELDKKITFNTIYEVFGLTSIYDMLSSINQNHLPINKIREMATDPIYSSDEDDIIGNSKSRNYQFELELAAFLFKCGANIKNFEDVTIKLNGYSLSFQCKRPKKAGNLKKVFKKAIRQLHTHNSGNPKNYHAIAISFEKILGLNNSWYESNDLQDILNKANLRMKELRKHTDILEDLVSETKCVMIYYCCRFMAWNREIGSFTPIFLSQPLQLNYQSGKMHKDDIWRQMLEIFNNAKYI